MSVSLGHGRHMGSEAASRSAASQTRFLEPEACSLACRHPL